MNRNLMCRFLSAVVLLPIVIFLILSGGWWFTGLIWLVLTLCLYEYVSMTANLKGRLMAITSALLSAMALASLPVFWGIATIVVGMTFVFRPNWSTNEFSKAAIVLFGLLYCTAGMGSLCELETFGSSFVFLVLIVTWSNDTFAYFAGRTFGKHKLCPAVSPSKTWEGAIGGAIGSIVMPFAFQNLLSLSTTDILWIAIPCTVLSPLGDLVESRLKRLFDTKDSGQLLPGHGG
ncbi:MAG: hypothetical protein EBR59_11425, partial [Methylococcaceae bacterium]|nr:hypothetical protein [Methylococcaceae bacterium]